MSNKIYVSDANYYPGSKELKKGTEFTEAEWVEAGSTAKALAVHVEKGYITEVVGKEEAEFVPVEAPAAEEQVEETAEEVPATPKPTGVWNYKQEDLEQYNLEILNTLYKDRAKEFDLPVRPFTNRENLITKMCSEN